MAELPGARVLCGVVCVCVPSFGVDTYRLTNHTWSRRDGSLQGSYGKTETPAPCVALGDGNGSAHSKPRQFPGVSRHRPVHRPGTGGAAPSGATGATAAAVGVLRESERLVGVAKLQAASKVGAVEQHLAAIRRSSEAEVRDAEVRLEEGRQRAADCARVIAESQAELLRLRPVAHGCALGAHVSGGAVRDVLQLTTGDEDAVSAEDVAWYEAAHTQALAQQDTTARRHAQEAQAAR